METKKTARLEAEQSWRENLVVANIPGDYAYFADDSGCGAHGEGGA
jgi:hypothetical protein